MIAFFENIKGLKEKAPGLDSSTQMVSLLPAYSRASIKIKKVLSITVWEQLVAAYGKNTDEDQDSNPTPEEIEAISMLQGALGNLIAYHDLMFKVIDKKKEDTKYYKYELQMIRESYLDNFAVYMDSLLDYLDLKAPIPETSEGEESQASKFPGWTDTDTYKLRQSLVLKSADEFNSVFPTGGSAYFFSMIVPLQNQVIRKELKARVKVDAIPDNMLDAVQCFVAYRTMASSARLVDYADLPQSLRQKLYVEDSKKKHSETETTAERYANLFDHEADGYLRTIDFELTKPTDGVSVVSPPNNDLNSESDQTFVTI